MNVRITRNSCIQCSNNRQVAANITEHKIKYSSKYVCCYYKKGSHSMTSKNNYSMQNPFIELKKKINALLTTLFV